MLEIVRDFEKERMKKDVPAFKPGDEIRVHVLVPGLEEERTQVFEGTVIARKNGGLRETFVVRKLSYGTGIERTFPLHSPIVKKIEMVKKGDVRRAKLYYLRRLKK